MEIANFVLNILILLVGIAGIWVSFHLYKKSGLRDKESKDLELKRQANTLVEGLKSDFDKYERFLKNHTQVVIGSSSVVTLTHVESVINDQVFLLDTGMKNFLDEIRENLREVRQVADSVPKGLEGSMEYGIATGKAQPNWNASRYQGLEIIARFKKSTN